jgi:hypothetical protein
MMGFDHRDALNSTMPFELGQPPPREVCLTTEGIWRASSAVVLLLIGFSWALLILVGFVHQKQRYEELKHQGRLTTASIVRVFTSVVYYSFTCNGAVVTGKSNIPSSLQSRPQESDPLLILYLPSDPRVNHPVSWEAGATEGLGLLVLPIGIVAIGAWVAHDLRTTRRIIRDGVVAAGVVQAWSRYNRTGEITVTYEFSTPNMVKREGLGWSEEPLTQGTQIWILYLPYDPRASTLYPLHHWRVTH